jgi:hypothetical protein
MVLPVVNQNGQNQFTFRRASLMKSRKIFVLFSLVVTLAFSASANDASRSGGPRLVMAAVEHSFGTVKPGTPLTYTFEVRNEGETTLEIKNVSPSCGCTTSKFDHEIAPGKTGGITLAVDKTDGYKGEVTKTATVTTNDPDRPTFVLTLRASFTE